MKDPTERPSPASQLPSVSVVVPSYRRREALPRFVAPILGDPALHELVAAVDGSDDGSVEWLTHLRSSDPRVVVLDLPNRGAGPTRQAGIEAASADVVLLMDDDVIAYPGLVTGHARHHRDGGRKLVLGYMPNDWRTLPPGRRAIARIYDRAYHHHVARFREDPEFVLHGFWGGNFSMRRADFLDVGIEGLAVRRGQDDREFGIRCLKAGIEPVFDPSLLATHEYSRSLRQYRQDMRVQGESRQLIHQVHEDLVGRDLVHEAHGPQVADAAGQGLPVPLRGFLPRLASDPWFRPVAGVLASLFHFGARTHWLGLEVFAARGLGSLEVQRGVLECSRARERSL